MSYSRGGIVYRSLLELVLPGADWRPRTGRAVFVAATNGDTQLAAPGNWYRLADLYVNLAVGAARGLPLLAPASPVSPIVSEPMQGLGALVKLLARHVVERAAVLGLAAMEPGGPFLKELNAAQAPAQGEEGLRRFAIISEFQAQIEGGEHAPRELPQRLLTRLGDALVDQLMGEANDLVVNTASMTHIDDAPAPLDDCYRFGATPRVYHLNYFAQPEVARCLADWLALSAD
ncbi:MAG: hypothetical protein IT208_15560 [Chthonomonadales bacterium]|nr:hypothetical protein [Chthonomonadales bacterium]